MPIRKQLIRALIRKSLLHSILFSFCIRSGKLLERFSTSQKGKLIMKKSDTKVNVVQNFDDHRFKVKDNILKGCQRDVHDDRHIGQILFDVLNENPLHVGIIDAVTGMKITFADMKEESVQLAIWLKKEGIIAGDIISLFSPIQRHVYSIFVATFFIGAIYNPMDYDVNIIKARSCLRITQPKIIFAHEAKVSVIKEAVALENHECKIVVLDEKRGLESFVHISNKDTNEKIERFQVLQKIDPDRICSIAFSSGTTGTPKSVPNSYEQIKIHAMTIFDEDVEDDLHLCYFYPSWFIHLVYSLGFILNKTTQVLHQTFHPSETYKIIERYKISTVSLDTYMFGLLGTSDLYGQHNLESVKMIIPVGNKLTTKAMKTIQNRFPNALISKRMGLTETGELTRFTKSCGNLLSEGLVRPNVNLTIKDLKTGEKLGPYKVGELCVKAPTVIFGYYKNPVETEQAFDHEGWFHSGDKAYYDENGEVVIVGRLKDMIRFRDIDIHSSYVEDLLLAVPGIAEAAVIGIPHEIYIERPIAFVKTISGSQITKDVISNVAKDLEYSDILKDAIEFIDEIPRNTHGKINKQVLKELAKKYYE